MSQQVNSGLTQASIVVGSATQTQPQLPDGSLNGSSVGVGALLTCPANTKRLVTGTISSTASTVNWDLRDSTTASISTWNLLARTTVMIYCLLDEGDYFQTPDAGNCALIYYDYAI